MTPTESIVRAIIQMKTTSTPLAMGAVLDEQMCKELLHINTHLIHALDVLEGEDPKHAHQLTWGCCDQSIEEWKKRGGKIEYQKYKDRMREIDMQIAKQQLQEGYGVAQVNQIGRNK